MYYKNGDRYDGEWKNWNKEGQGIYYFSNGKIERGYWKKNELIAK